MNRRQLLRAVGVGTMGPGLAGCNTGTNESHPTTTSNAGETPTATVSNSGPTATPIDEDPPTYRSAGSRRVALDGEPFVAARVDSMPDPVPFQPWIELLDQPSPTGTGRIRVGMTNRADRSLYLFGATPNPMAGSQSDAGITIGEFEGEIHKGCARELRRTGTGVLSHRSVKPHFGISTTHAIFVTHERDVCFPAGEHRFTGQREVYTDPAADEAMLAFEWGFSLLVD